MYYDTASPDYNADDAVQQGLPDNVFHDTEDNDSVSQPAEWDHHQQPLQSDERTGVRDEEIPGVGVSPYRRLDERDTVYEQFRRAEEHGRCSAPTTPGRPQRARTSTHTGDYIYLTALLDPLDPVDDDRLFSLVTEQLTAQKGNERFGEAGKDAIGKELEQLLTRRVMHGVHAHQLTPAKRHAALRHPMFLK